MELHIGRSVTCCKDCTKRKIGCHSTCEEYLKERQEQNELNEKRKKFKDAENDFIRLKSRRR